MSLSFPALTLPKGLGWHYAKRSKFSTIQQTPQSGRQPAVATLQQSVVYELELVFNYLKNNGVTFSNDAAYVQSFYEACRGGYGFFTLDPSQFNLEPMSVTHDYTQLVNGYFGQGDGVTTTFPLWRSTSAFGGGIVTLLEMIQNVTGLSGIYVNGAAQSFASFTQTNFPAQVTFNTAPGAGLPLAWEGTYNYLCKFDADLLDMDEFLYQLWELKSLKLETVLL